MKTVFTILMLTLSASAFADNSCVSEGAPCQLEGMRAYEPNAEDSRNSDVFVCKDGKWSFLYTREWNEGQE